MQSLQDRLPHEVVTSTDPMAEEASSSSISGSNALPPFAQKACTQRKWDIAMITPQSLSERMADSAVKAQLLAARSPHLGDWQIL